MKVLWVLWARLTVPVLILHRTITGKQDSGRLRVYILGVEC